MILFGSGLLIENAYVNKKNGGPKAAFFKPTYKLSAIFYRPLDIVVSTTLPNDRP
jgi:hypothetical protein